MLKDRLPSPSIKIDTTPRDFIDQLEILARQTGRFKVTKEYEHGSEKRDFLVLKPKVPTKHRGLIGQVITNPDDYSRVKISMNAYEWDPDPVTYEVYVQETVNFFKPLLKKYNRYYNSKRRIHIQPKESLEPRLAPKAKKAFDFFISKVNPYSIHDSDWRCFYEFIRICHEGRAKAYEDDIIRLLYKNGFSEEEARYFADIYYHIRRYLQGNYHYGIEPILDREWDEEFKKNHEKLIKQYRETMKIVTSGKNSIES